MNTIGTREGGQPKIGDDEPLRGTLAVIAAWHVGRLRREQIDAGLHLRYRFHDRESGGDLLIELFFNLELAGPYLLALLVGDLVEAVAVEIALEVVAEHVVEQVAVADAVDSDLDRVGVDGDERNALLTCL